MLEEIVVLDEGGGDVVGAAAHEFLVLLGVGGLGVEENPGNFEVKQFLFNLRVHQDLIRNVSFQMRFVDALLEPFLRQQLIDQTQRYHVLALELLPSTHAPLVLLLEAQLGQVFYDGYEDVLGVIFLELRGHSLSSQLVGYFVGFLLRIGFPS